ncbi:GtrA family protein [Metabacillus sp. HB246100]
MKITKNLTIKFTKYSLIGTLTTLLYFISMFLFVELVKLEPVLSATISFLVMTFFSFLLNRKYTFGGTYSHIKLYRFSIVGLIALLLNFVIMYLVVHHFSYHYLIGEIVTLLIIPLVNFTLNNWWTFR